MAAIEGIFVPNRAPCAAPSAAPWARTRPSFARRFSKLDTENMSHKTEAIGILETQGLTAILEATDAMLKAANVTVIVRGDVAALRPK